MAFKENIEKFLGDYTKIIDYYPVELQYIFDQAHQATRLLYESGLMDKVFNFINNYTNITVSSPYELFTLSILIGGHPKALEAAVKGSNQISGLLLVLSDNKHDDIVEPIIQELQAHAEKVSGLVDQLTKGFMRVNKIDPPTDTDGPS